MVRFTAGEVYLKVWTISSSIGHDISVMATYLSHGQYVNKWAWLCSNRSFSKVSRPYLA
jgi:hypothetical protein